MPDSRKPIGSRTRGPVLVASRHGGSGCSILGCVIASGSCEGVEGSERGIGSEGMFAIVGLNGGGFSPGGLFMVASSVGVEFVTFLI